MHVLNCHFGIERRFVYHLSMPGADRCAGESTGPLRSRDDRCIWITLIRHFLLDFHTQFYNGSRKNRYCYSNEDYSRRAILNWE